MSTPMASRPEPQDAQHPRTRKRRGSMNGCGNIRRPGSATTRDRFRVRASAFRAGYRFCRCDLGIRQLCTPRPYLACPCIYLRGPWRSRAVVGLSLGPWILPRLHSRGPGAYRRTRVRATAAADGRYSEPRGESGGLGRVPGCPGRRDRK
jgi:hypothetical protein